MATSSSFKSQYDLEKRQEVSGRIRSKYPDRIPVIVERAANSNAPQIDKKKFLVPEDISVGKFLYEIRKHMKLSEEQAIFLFVNNALPQSSSLISQIYTQHADDDGFLYITYSGENTFGGQSCWTRDVTFHQ